MDLHQLGNVHSIHATSEVCYVGMGEVNVYGEYLEFTVTTFFTAMPPRLGSQR